MTRKFKCVEKTCLAFAAMVYQSRKNIRMCPRLDSKIVAHINPWITGPFLDYVVNAKGIDPAGEGVSFRELFGP